MFIISASEGKIKVATKIGPLAPGLLASVPSTRQLDAPKLCIPFQQTLQHLCLDTNQLVSQIYVYKYSRAIF